MSNGSDPAVLAKLKALTSELKGETSLLKKAWKEVDAEVGNFISKLGDAKSAATGLVSAFTGWNVSLQSVISHTDAMSEFTAQMNRATGQAGNLSAALKEHRKAADGMAVGYGELTKHMTAAVTTVTDFTKVDAKMQGQIAGTISKLTKLGIAAESGGKMIDSLNKGLGLSPGIASKAAIDIAKVARSLGVAPAKMAKDFEAAMPTLAAYGQEGIKVFYKLAAQAKATGVEMNDLLGVTKKFDTFESAAKQTAQLNAVMGTTINSVDMLMASEEDRLKILKQGVEATGKSWEGMGRFEKKALAAAAGFDDVSKAGKFFMGTMSELEAEEAKADPALVSQEALNAAMKRGVSRAQAMKAMLEGIHAAFAKVIMPLVGKFIKFFIKYALPEMKKFLTWIDTKIKSVGRALSDMGEGGEVIKQILGTFLGIAVAIGPFMGILAAILPLISAIGAVVAAVFSPWLLAILALGAAFVGIQKDWGSVTGGFSTFIKNDLPEFKKGFVEVWGDRNKGVVKKIITSFEGMWESIKGVFKKIWDASGLGAKGLFTDWKDAGAKIAEFIGNAFKVIGEIFEKTMGLFGDFEPLVGGIGDTIEGFFGAGGAERMFGTFGKLFNKYVLFPMAKYLDVFLSSNKAAGVMAEQFGFEGGEAGGKKVREMFGLVTEGQTLTSKIIDMEKDYDESIRKANKLRAAAPAKRGGPDKPGRTLTETAGGEEVVKDALSRKAPRAFDPGTTPAPPPGQPTSDTILQVFIDRERFFQIVVDP